MAKLVLVLFLFLSVVTNAQSNDSILLNTEYTTIVETICEEMSVPDPCAGQEVYLILTFHKSTVSIVEKMVSSCGVEDIQYQFEYPWSIDNQNEITISAKPKAIKYSSLEGLTLTVEGNEIHGLKKAGNDEPIPYIFLNMSN